MANPGKLVDLFKETDDMVVMASRIKQLYFDLKGMQQSHIQRNYLATIKLMDTYAVNPDGSPGPSDGAPNNANPIVGLPISANNISDFMGYLVGDLIRFIDGIEVVTADRKFAIEQMLP